MLKLSVAFIGGVLAPCAAFAGNVTYMPTAPTASGSDSNGLIVLAIIAALVALSRYSGGAAPATRSATDPAGSETDTNVIMKF